MAPRNLSTSAGIAREFAPYNHELGIWTAPTVDPARARHFGRDALNFSIPSLPWNFWFVVGIASRDHAPAQRDARHRQAGVTFQVPPFYLEFPSDHQKQTVKHWILEHVRLGGRVPPDHEIGDR